MKKRKFLNNQGYSMVELVIVICIIGILTAMSLITWRSVDSARYKKSVSTLESELATLRKATMAQDSRMAFRLYYDESLDAYVIERGYWGKAGTESTGVNAFHSPEDAGTDADGYVLANSSYYNYTGTTNPVNIMKRGTIEYWIDSDDDGTLEKVSIPSVSEATDKSGVVIWFNKSDGSVRKGAGEFRLFRSNGDLYTTIHLVEDTGLYFETY